MYSHLTVYSQNKSSKVIKKKVVTSGNKMVTLVTSGNKW